MSNSYAKNNAYEKYVERLDRFNVWELALKRRLSTEETEKQFVELYQLKDYLPPGVVKSVQDEHLQGLIETRKILRNQKKE